MRAGNFRYPPLAPGGTAGSRRLRAASLWLCPWAAGPGPLPSEPSRLISRLEACQASAAAPRTRWLCLHTGGAVSLCVAARPCRRPRIPRRRPPAPTPAALCRCVWYAVPAAAHGHRGLSSGSGAPPCTHVVSCVADPGGRIPLQWGLFYARWPKASPGPPAFGPRRGASPCRRDRASQAQQSGTAVAPRN